MAVRTPDEILEEQRAEATKAYASSVSDLQKQVIELEARKKDLKNTLDEAFVNKQKELEEIESHLRSSAEDIDKLRVELATSIREAAVKNKEADDILENAKSERKSHDENLQNHLNSVGQTREDLAQRLANCMQLEEQAKVKNAEADEKLALANKREEEIKIAREELEKSSKILDEKYQKNKELEHKNSAEVEEIENKKSEFINIQQKNESDIRELVVMRDDLDASRTSLAKRKSELDAKEIYIKSEQIKIALGNQRLQEKEKDIASQEGKLNELKNNVDALMQLRKVG